MERIDTDVVVVGSGIAGLVLAKLAARHGEVVVVTKKEDSESSTNYAQGGIAAVMDPKDSFESHVEDTLRAGAGLCKRESVEVLVREGPALVRQLVEWGARFNRTPNGASFDLGMEGGHSRRRILHAEDQTGQEIERALLHSLREDPVRIVEHEMAVSLMVSGPPRSARCHGVVTLGDGDNVLRAYCAKATVLATGGKGRVYLHTTNPSIATGDGVAMAYRVGARVANLEFIQFHPTAFYAERDPETFLISEAVRGEGAVLRNIAGETFMELYDPRGCLAPRDIVARAIDREMKKTGDPHVFLDMRGLGEPFLTQRFPYITAKCREKGVDPARVLVPVVPAAHYSCGGIFVDLFGQTNVDCLYATGEVSCTGVHGANRLASNSLLEALVWSCRAAKHIAERLPKLDRGNVIEQRLGGGDVAELEGVRVSHCLDEVRRLMWDYVGIVRSDERLRLADRRIQVIRREVEEYIARGFLNSNLVQLWNVVEVAELIVRSALLRKESRGLHYNVDHPERDDANWLHDTVLMRRYVQ